MSSQVRGILLPALAAIAPAAYHLYSPAAQTEGRVKNIPSLLPLGYGYILLMLLFTSTVTSIASRRDRPTFSTPYSSTFNYALPTLLSGLFWPKLALALAAAQFWGVVLTVALAPASSSPPSSANNPAAVLGKTPAAQQAGDAGSGGGGYLLTIAKSIEAASLLGLTAAAATAALLLVQAHDLKLDDVAPSIV